MSKNIPFPIKTNTACLLKWNWSTIFINQGSTASCHRNWHVPLPLEEFDNFHNLPYKIDHRKSMLRGEWPHSPDHLGCGYCKNIEDAGERSDRQFMNEIMTDQTPDELVDDPTATHVMPAILEVFVNRLCNMSCTYCYRGFSSKIEAEAKKFDNPEFDDKYFGNPKLSLDWDEQQKYRDALFSWIKNNGTCLRRFHLLGGEPFILPDIDRYLDIWREAPNPNLILNVVSNMSISQDRFSALIDKIFSLIKDNCIERFDLTCSIDCWGPEQEYVRTGFNSKQVEQNLLYALSIPEISVNINATHSVLSLSTYADLLEKKAEWQSITGNPIALYGMLVDKEYASCDMLGSEFFQEDFDKILKMHPQESEDDRQAYQNILGLIQTIKTNNPSPKKIKEFIEVYDELDRRRNTDWRSVYPHIAHEVKKYHNVV